jgi:quinol monooxygenase YgiN
LALSAYQEAPSTQLLAPFSARLGERWANQAALSAHLKVHWANRAVLSAHLAAQRLNQAPSAHLQAEWEN